MTVAEGIGSPGALSVTARLRKPLLVNLLWSAASLPILLVLGGLYMLFGSRLRSGGAGSGSSTSHNDLV